MWNADILLVDSHDYLVEFEVNVSTSDLKADFEKKKHRRSSSIKELALFTISTKLLKKQKNYTPQDGVGINNLKTHSRREKSQRNSPSLGRGYIESYPLHYQVVEWIFVKTHQSP
jgi:hypothetical protein